MGIERRILEWLDGIIESAHRWVQERLRRGARLSTEDLAELYKSAD